MSIPMPGRELHEAVCLALGIDAGHGSKVAVAERSGRSAEGYRNLTSRSVSASQVQNLAEDLGLSVALLLLRKTEHSWLDAVASTPGVTGVILHKLPGFNEDGVPRRVIQIDGFGIRGGMFFDEATLRSVAPRLSGPDAVVAWVQLAVELRLRPESLPQELMLVSALDPKGERLWP